ncbi:MAG: LysM peptidoglycan-binding domain-containing protein [Chloroflexi bacterium]|nr:LysM peptidoglycan-binding domain-containing protein [Chloroflexota bacterium]
MSHQEQPSPGGDWRTSVILTAGVLLTLLLAIFLAVADELQMRLPLPLRPPGFDGALVTSTRPPTTPAFPSPDFTASSAAVAAGTASVTPTPSLPATTPTAVSLVITPSCGQIPAGWTPYTVRPGDSLYRLSIQTGATVSEISQVNCLERYQIYSGTILYVPLTPPTRVPCGPPQSWKRTLIQPGDTLFSLAGRYRTTINAIMQANCLVSTRIYAGQYLFLPSPPAATPTKPPTATATPPATAVASSTSSTTPLPTTTATGTPPAPPTATATSTPEPTPQATIQPTSTATPLPTTTPTPTVAPTVAPTATPTPTPLPPPTATATAAPSPIPTDTPQPEPPNTNTPSATIPP